MQHPALDIALEVVEWSLPGNNDLPADWEAYTLSLEDRFIALMKRVRTIYRAHWPTMRAYRRHRDVPPPANATIFAVDLMLASPDSELVVQEFSGYVEDEEEDGFEETVPTLFVAAEWTDEEQREPESLWEESVSF